MHPRQMQRPIHRRPPTAAELRRIYRETPAALPEPNAAPNCAFAAVQHGSDVRIEVTRGFAVHFPFAGNVKLAFPTGTPIEVWPRRDWKPGEQIVIVAERATIGDGYRLFALPRELAEAARDIALGGFGLDASGAILASSFWDANLDDVAPQTCTTAEPVARRIADIFVARAKDGFDDTTAVDLVREGISERDAMQHYEAGAAIAATELKDTDAAGDRVSYDREARVMLGANAIAGALDPDTVHTMLRGAGLSTPEIGRLFDDIVGNALRLMRKSREALRTVQ